MKFPFNTQCFGLRAVLVASGEKGRITGFCLHMRSKQKQFFVEYVAADGRQTEGWFFEDQLAKV